MVNLPLSIPLVQFLDLINSKLAGRSAYFAKIPNTPFAASLLISIFAQLKGLNSKVKPDDVNIPLAVFKGTLAVVINETGSFNKFLEMGGIPYFFAAAGSPYAQGVAKQSYNGLFGGELAGNELKRIKPDTPADIIALANEKNWNPRLAPYLPYLVNTSPSKYAGKGVIQMTGYGNYKAYVEPFIKKKYGKSLSDLTNSQLSEIMSKDPEIMGQCVAAYFNARGLGDLHNPLGIPIAVNGSSSGVAITYAQTRIDLLTKVLGSYMIGVHGESYAQNSNQKLKLSASDNPGLTKVSGRAGSGMLITDDFGIWYKI